MVTASFCVKMKCLDLLFLILFLACIPNVKSQNDGTSCTKIDSLKYVKINIFDAIGSSEVIYKCSHTVNKTFAVKDGKWNRPDDYCSGPVMNNFVRISNAELNTPKKRYGEIVSVEICAQECLKRMNCLSFEIESGKCFLCEYVSSDTNLFRRNVGRYHYKRFYPSEEYIFVGLASIPGRDNLGRRRFKTEAQCKESCRKNPRCRSFEILPRCQTCSHVICALSTANISQFIIIPSYRGWNIYLLNPYYKRNCGKPDPMKYANLDLFDNEDENMATYKCLPSESAPEIVSENAPNNAVGKYKNLASPTISCTDPHAYSCVKIRKCAFFTRDTEVIISPRLLKGQKVSVFCGGMSTDVPKEYITLRKPTYFEVHVISDMKSCPSVGANGRRRYSKVRFLTEEMALDLSDEKFTTFEPLPPGKEMCLSKQNITIDLRRTDFIISEKADWATSGVSAKITSTQISKDKQVAVISCSGKCGICKTISPLPVKRRAYS